MTVTERFRQGTRRLQAAAGAPRDIASLVAFRVAFGALLLIAVLRHLAYGWVESLYVAPRLFFPYPGLEWIVPLPAAGMYALYAGLAVSALAIAAGAWTRLAAAAFTLGFTYVHLIDRTTYLNHYYLVSLVGVLLVAVPAGAAGSVDAWRRPAARRGALPAWMLWLLRAQLAVVYVFGAVAKLNPDWLLRAQPLRLWLGANADLPLLGPWLEQAWVAYAVSYAGLAFDAAIVPLLLWRRTRVAAYGLVLVFHLLTALLFPIGMFPWLMIALTPIFFAADWPRRWWRWAPAAAPVAATRRWAPAVALLWVAIQVAVPLRHLAYDGDLYWTEAGFRWSWQIMVMEKYGHASFTVRDPASGADWRVVPGDELTAFQDRMLATQPDMILSYAQHLARRWAGRLGHPVEVRADVRVTWNGRPNAPLVDPRVDLAALPAGAAPSAWLLPRPRL